MIPQVNIDGSPKDLNDLEGVDGDSRVLENVLDGVPAARSCRNCYRSAAPATTRICGSLHISRRTALGLWQLQRRAKKTPIAIQIISLICRFKCRDSDFAVKTPSRPATVKRGTEYTLALPIQSRRKSLALRRRCRCLLSTSGITTRTQRRAASPLSISIFTRTLAEVCENSQFTAMTGRVRQR